MQEFLYHALGICGEHWHPNLLNITLIVMATSIITRIVYKKITIKK
tara:strand:+ start:465 stop:602 length:138 start_codon:yes stop_codon:yes gene_type:complete